MKPTGLRWCLGLAVVVVALAWAPRGQAQVERKHRFLCVDNAGNKLVLVDQFKPAAGWSVAIPSGSRDLQLLDGGRVLVGHGNGCGLYALADGRRLWSCDGFKDVQTARYVPARQRVLLGWNTAAGYEFAWLARDGEGFKPAGETFSIPVKGPVLRLARLTPEGRLLVTAGEPTRVLEWDIAQGKEVWSATFPGKGYQAERLSDGTTLVTTGGECTVVALDKSGKVTRTWLDTAARGQHRLKWFSGFQRLANGNLLVANWLGHGALGSGPHAVEVSADGRVVWQWEDHQAAKTVTNVLALDEPAATAATPATPTAKPAEQPKERKPAAVPATHRAAFEYDRLKRHLSEYKQWNRGRLAREAHRREALIFDSDTSPTDIVLRRTQALLGDLRAMRNAPDLTAEARELAALQTAAETQRRAGKPGDADEKALFEKAITLRRRIAFRNPLLDFDRVAFLKHPPSVRGDNHMVDQYLGFNQAKVGGVYVLEQPFAAEPKVTNLLANSPVTNGRLKGKLLENAGSFASLDLDYDGQSLAFAFTEAEHEVPANASWDDQRWTKEECDRLKGNRHYHWRPDNCFHLFRAKADGSGLTQLTDGPYNEYDPCFLPTGRIAFVSERVGGGQRCGARLLPSATLFSVEGDGSDLIQLSWHDTNEWHPSVDNDGMLVYTRWDYVDRDSDIAHHLWRCFPDGRDPRSAHGNYPEIREMRPWMEMSIRAIPNSHRYVAVAAAHHGQNYGSLVLIDQREPDDRACSQIRRITPEVKFPESETAPGYPYNRGAKRAAAAAPADDLPDSDFGSGKSVGEGSTYSTPWPLSEDYYLCVGQLAGSNWGIFLLDSFGNRELLYADPAVACLDPIPLRARRRPPVIPAATTQARRDQPKNADLSTGLVFVRNVYESDQPWPKGAKVSGLRVVNIFPKDNAFLDVPRIGSAAQSLARGVLGTVPVEADGSAYFRVPTGAAIYFQALDEKGLALHTMRSSTYVHPGETLSCTGCHESKHRASKATGPEPLALGRAPSALTPDVSGSFPLTFPRLVQPVLDRQCVPCHSQEKKAPSLRGDKLASNHWSEAMQTLRQYAWGRSGGNGIIFKEGRQYSVPGQDCARVSKLYKLLAAGHHDVKLSAEEMHRITLWIDCNSNYFGAYGEPARQAKGEVVKPREGLPKWVAWETLVR